MLSNQEYETKLDSYYYDQKLRTIIIALKIRNKRSIYYLPIQKLLRNEIALNSLHPIDLCVIGVLANTSPAALQNSQGNLAPPRLDFLSMVKTAPLLEIISHDYSGNEEVLVLKLKSSNKIARITITELCKNKNLISALRYQDALSLGYSISDPACFLQKNTELYRSYSMFTCIKNGLFLSLLLLSMLMLCKPIALSILGYEANLKGEILILPFLFQTLNAVLETHGTANTNKLILATMFVLITFLMYFGFITTLPYSANDTITISFNTLYYTLTSQPPLYILSFFATSIIKIYTSRFTNRKLKKFHPIVKSNLADYFYISIFFIISAIFCLLLNQTTYLLVNYFYSILVISCISSIKNFCSARVNANSKSIKSALM